MKNFTLILLIFLIAGSPIYANNNRNPKDTVVIEFGERSKMVIYAETQQDLKDLEAYDINAMIGELNASLDSTSAKTKEVSISDETGEKYLKEGEEESENSTSLKYYGDDDSDYDDSDSERYYSRSYSDDDDDDYEYTSPKSNFGRTYSSFEMELGMNNWLEGGSFPDINNEPYAVKPWGSWYIGVGGMNNTAIAGPLYLKWGGNITWYNWKMEDKSVIIEKTDTGTIFTTDPTVDPKKTKLAATYINAMLIPMFDLSHKRNSRSGKKFSVSKYRKKGFRIGGGMYVGYRIDSWTRRVYKFDGNEFKDKDHGNYYLNNFRYGVRGQLGYKGMDFFVNYDLNTVFASGRGPELNAISFGFIL